MAGTTILTAIRNAVDPLAEVVFTENPEAGYVKENNFSYAVVVVGEPPYAETFGDSLNLTLPEPGPSVVTGRPVVIETYVAEMDAVVAAWLPRSEGQGVADVLFGDYGFTGRLPHTWFKNVGHLPMNVGDKHYDPLFKFGYGLTTKAN